MVSEADKKFMKLAIEQASKGLYTTRCNPRVGCVIVKDNCLIGRGWHQKPGFPHAEIEALNDASANSYDANGAACYVTLEPCCHYGKTGPCVEALIDAGISRVIYGQEDPNPLVGGQSIEKLRSHGITVDGAVLDRTCRELNPGFNKRMSTGLPWVRIKSAVSMDARSAMADGHSFWITGPKARRDVQLLRAQSCAIITSWATIVRDNASLTVRPDEFDLPEALQDIVQPLRVVVDSQAKADKTVAFFQAEGDIYHACVDARATHGENKVNLLELLKKLASKDINEVLIEAGATLSGAFVKAGLFDELIVYMAPKLMGSSSMPMFNLSCNTMDEALPFYIDSVETIGRDLKIRYLPEKE